MVGPCVCPELDREGAVCQGLGPLSGSRARPCVNCFPQAGARWETDARRRPERPTAQVPVDRGRGG